MIVLRYLLTYFELQRRALSYRRILDAFRPHAFLGLPCKPLELGWPEYPGGRLVAFDLKFLFRSEIVDRLLCLYFHLELNLRERHWGFAGFDLLAWT